MPSHLEPRWRPAHHYFHLTQIQKQWLLDERSLTARLKKLSANQFRVEVLQQYWGNARHSESRFLNIRPHSICLIREVFLFGQHDQWIFARSVMPATALVGSLHRLRSLKNTSLGELLFRDKTLTRSHFELATFSPQHPHLPTQLNHDTALLARRCRFELNQKSLLVSEIFLPALWQKIHHETPYA